jgi:phosphatidylinositol alpha-1,6-mannosyltransferase
MSPRVLFVSKPIAPPFHDGTKCLVRDIASNLDRAVPIVMSARGAPPLRARDGTSIEQANVYGSSGTFTPSVGQNARAALWLLFRSRADVWHFVFAPNPRSSAMGRRLRALRRVPVVQTVASPPRSFREVRALVFGDVVVAQSRWTRDRLVGALDEEGVPSSERPEITVIPPPIGVVTPRSVEQRARARAELGIAGDVPLFVYPGDLETSTGAETVAALSTDLSAELPGAVTVFAYRNKSDAAPEIARRLEARLDASATRFTNAPGDLLALLSASTALLFPVDDLWGKVDLPIVLLEAMKLGVPVIAIDHGPLADLRGAELVPHGDRAALHRAAVAMTRDGGARQAVVERQLESVKQFEASRIAQVYEGLYLELFARGRTP